MLGVWGPDGTRVAASEAMWREPLAWDKAAAAEGVRLRVFSASLSDVFEEWPGPVVDSKGRPLGTWGGAWPWAPCPGGVVEGEGFRAVTLDDLRRRLFGLILATPHLDWLLLTKRPENVVPMLVRCSDSIPGDADPLGAMVLAWATGHPPANVWLGTSVEDQATADARLPVLLEIPAALRWASLEPLLGPVDLGLYLGPCPCCHGAGCRPGRGFGVHCRRRGLDWAVVGGESGAFEKVRPFHTAWADELIGQCREAGVPCFVKQMGSHCRSYRAPQEWAPGVRCHVTETIMGPYAVQFDAPAGGDPAEWPADLRVREFPEAPARPEAEAVP